RDLNGARADRFGDQFALGPAERACPQPQSHAVAGGRHEVFLVIKLRVRKPRCLWPAQDAQRPGFTGPAQLGPEKLLAPPGRDTAELLSGPDRLQTRVAAQYSLRPDPATDTEVRPHSLLGAADHDLLLGMQRKRRSGNQLLPVTSKLKCSAVDHTGQLAARAEPRSHAT